MEIKKILGLSDYEYNMIILEIGCKAAENRYPENKANVLKSNKKYWNWVRQQINIRNIDFTSTLEKHPSVWNTKQVVELYKDYTLEKLDNTSFPSRFAMKLLTETI
ncbi:hypothetical protein [Gabonibacter chumensis]|uniref:hypothetical protein n=1 Tax=Gabonibacter chumensis TaxID=2972474 RepID=UPI0025742905|nr:hypothetical protein [Gabonibacter chumensis]MCR9011981.1 hypothetical protein [Gabonibacter chumensis]